MAVSVEVIGKEPVLLGLCCEELICESYVFHGEIATDANVVYIRAGGYWHRLLIDAGVIFWKKQEEEPRPWAVPAEGWSYPHRNIGKEFGLNGQEFASVAIRRQGDVVEVQLHFQNGKSFTLRNVNDCSSFTVA